MVAEGLEPGAPDQVSDELLARAERRARISLNGRAPEDVPQVVGWRAAYRAFGAKPQRAVEGGLAWVLRQACERESVSAAASGDVRVTRRRCSQRGPGWVWHNAVSLGGVSPVTSCAQEPQQHAGQACLFERCRDQAN